jgi:preprotein translocase subunit SecY
VSKVLNRITCLGALLLTFIAILPYVVSAATGLSSSAAVGGTGIIIVVGVAMETVSQLKGQLTQKSYRGFLR